MLLNVVTAVLLSVAKYLMWGNDCSGGRGISNESPGNRWIFQSHVCDINDREPGT